jgi:hypothetical protein
MPGPPATGPPAKLPPGPLGGPVRPCLFCPGGGPCLDNENAFIRAAMSELSPLALAGRGPGLRAAFVGPRGLEEEVMFADGGLEELVLFRVGAFLEASGEDGDEVCGESDGGAPMPLS